jgi:type I site-specific restriction endonuclease
MSSTLDTIRDALQVALLPKLTAIEKDLQAFRAEVAQSNQALRAELAQSNQELRAEVAQSNQTLRAELAQSNQELRSEAIENYQGLRAEMHQNNLELRGEMKELRAELELKFSILVNEVQKIGIRTELTFDRIKAENETVLHRSITPLAERVAVLEMSLSDLKAKLEKAS